MRKDDDRTDFCVVINKEQIGDEAILVTILNICEEYNYDHPPQIVKQVQGTPDAVQVSYLLHYARA